MHVLAEPSSAIRESLFAHERLRMTSLPTLSPLSYGKARKLGNDDFLFRHAWHNFMETQWMLFWDKTYPFSIDVLLWFSQSNLNAEAFAKIERSNIQPTCTCQGPSCRNMIHQAAASEPGASMSRYFLSRYSEGNLQQLTWFSTRKLLSFAGHGVW